MTQMLDCLVSYFGLDGDERPGYRRYFCYHIVAGPGPTLGAGVAAVTTVAVYDEAQRCTYCQKFHTAEAGGPAAALAAAVRYLDAFHRPDHVTKVQSEVRGLAGEQARDAVRSPDTRFRAAREEDLPTRVG
jgi:hypothetical protein